MSREIGFVLLTHTKPAQTARLIATLNAMFDDPPIALHNDFGKCQLDPGAITKNVDVVSPHLNTFWGSFALVEAVVLGLEALYRRPDGPDWVVLLSGADYPVKPAAAILADLRSSPFHAHIENQRIEPKLFASRWERLCYKRYLVKKLRTPLRKGGIPLRWPWPLVSRWTAFTGGVGCYAGEFWFCVRREVAEFVIEQFRGESPLTRFYKDLETYGVYYPDESYFHSVICNEAAFAVSNENYRFIKWSSSLDHPDTLGLNDVPRLLGSSAHFARKFDIDADPKVLDDIDESVILIDCLP